MPALHGAPEAPRFVPKGSAVPTLHLWVEGNKVSESAEPTGADVQSEHKDRWRRMNTSSGESTEARGPLAARVFMILCCFPKPLPGSIRGGRAGALSVHSKTPIEGLG